MMREKSANTMVAPSLRISPSSMRNTCGSEVRVAGRSEVRVARVCIAGLGRSEVRVSRVCIAGMQTNASLGARVCVFGCPPSAWCSAAAAAAWARAGSSVDCTPIGTSAVGARLQTGCRAPPHPSASWPPSPLGCGTPACSPLRPPPPPSALSSRSRSTSVFRGAAHTPHVTYLNDQITTKLMNKISSRIANMVGKGLKSYRNQLSTVPTLTVSKATALHFCHRRCCMQRVDGKMVEAQLHTHAAVCTRVAYCARKMVLLQHQRRCGRVPQPRAAHVRLTRGGYLPTASVREGV
eukprot:1195292-Prorocentrum_minimum.AAC.4